MKIQAVCSRRVSLLDLRSALSEPTVLNNLSRGIRGITHLYVAPLQELRELHPDPLLVKFFLGKPRLWRDTEFVKQKSLNGIFVNDILVCAREELNFDYSLRRAVFYPLNYERIYLLNKYNRKTPF